MELLCSNKTYINTAFHFAATNQMLQVGHRLLRFYNG